MQKKVTDTYDTQKACVGVFLLSRDDGERCLPLFNYYSTWRSEFLPLCWIIWFGNKAFGHLIENLDINWDFPKWNDHDQRKVSSYLSLILLIVKTYVQMVWKLWSWFWMTVIWNNHGHHPETDKSLISPTLFIFSIDSRFFYSSLNYS